MSSEVRHLVDRGLAYPLVRLSGVLDSATAPAVRSVLLNVLAEQPEALVVDVSELRVAGSGAAQVLRDVRRDTADWPAAHLALCGGTRATPWRDTGWPVWSDCPEAFAELGTPEHDRRLSLALEPQVGSARRSRELITEACGRWDCPELAGAACIVATEMVNNVVAHAKTPMVVLLAAHGAGMTVAVRDRSAVVPSFTAGPVSPTAFGGRGMLLIDAVASRWGSLVLDGGKVMWALLEPGGPAGPARRNRSGASMAGPTHG